MNRVPKSPVTPAVVAKAAACTRLDRHNRNSLLPMLRRAPGISGPSPAMNRTSTPLPDESRCRCPGHREPLFNYSALGSNLGGDCRVKTCLRPMLRTRNDDVSLHVLPWRWGLPQPCHCNNYGHPTQRLDQKCVLSQRTNMRGVFRRKPKNYGTSRNIQDPGSGPVGPFSTKAAVPRPIMTKTAIVRGVNHGTAPDNRRPISGPTQGDGLHRAKLPDKVDERPISHGTFGAI